MLKVPPPTRVPLGALQVGGQKFELILSPEWARYFESLNTQVQSNAASLAQSAALTAFLGDGGDGPDGPPGPQGKTGMQGEPGLPLFLLQDDPGEQQMLVPPCVDGIYVPLASKDAPDGVPALTQLKLNLKNAAGTITSWFTTAATAARTWTMPNKDGTVAVLEDFSAPPEIGNTTAAPAKFTNVTADTFNGQALGSAAFSSSSSFAPAGGAGSDWQAGKFSCNGKAPQAAAASGGTLAGVIAALVANGILSS